MPSERVHPLGRSIPPDASNHLPLRGRVGLRPMRTISVPPMTSVHIRTIVTKNREITMTRSTLAMALMLTVAASASAALANDVVGLRLLDQQKQTEAFSTSTVVLGNDLKPMPVAVISKTGPMRDVGVVIMDMRAVYEAPFMSRLLPPEIHADRKAERLLEEHPVIRIAGSVDCRTGAALWKSLDYADTTTSKAESRTNFKDPSNNGNLPSRIDDAARVAICATTPAEA